jgi:N-acetylneuraminate synthase
MSRTFVIAEAGVNHNGSIRSAIELVNIAAQAGADAVKFQTFRAEDLVTLDAKLAAYQEENSPGTKTQLEMLKRLELSEADHFSLSEHCLNKKIEFLSTPFDLKSVDFLGTSLRVKRLKISSGDLTNAPLLLRAAQTGLPIILSTGMSVLEEIRFALSTLAFGYLSGKAPSSRDALEAAFASERGQAELRQKVTVLHCTSEYPAPYSTVNLRAMETILEAFSLDVGFSDHT